MSENTDKPSPFPVTDTGAAMASYKLAHKNLWQLNNSESLKIVILLVLLPLCSREETNLPFFWIRQHSYSFTDPFPIKCHSRAMWNQLGWWGTHGRLESAGELAPFQHGERRTGSTFWLLRLPWLLPRNGLWRHPWSQIGTTYTAWALQCLPNVLPLCCHVTTIRCKALS